VLIHTLFDLLAALSSFTIAAICVKRGLTSANRVETIGLSYVVALAIGAVIGGYGAGTLNLYLSGVQSVGRSIVGALAGAIVAIELLKQWKGIRQSTGLVFVPAFAASVAVGRLGCYFAGLEDHTHGIATNLPWGHDFGDGILRHPVQLYESVTMLGVLTGALVLLARKSAIFVTNGFYIIVFFYGVQRFIWEFLKPYETVVGPFNLFHFICAGLVCYAFVMMGKGTSHERATA
jgi:phosphatidylglycerol---prolipoprotein diacylglyceryl transferase